METTQTAEVVIGELYRVHRQPVLRYLRGLVGEYETAEDLCHETFVKALLHQDQLSAAANAQAWLFRIARNTAFDYFRRRRRMTLTTLDEEGSEAQALVIDLEHADPLWEVLRQLPDQHRLTLLQIAAGYQPRDIARLLGSNVATVRSRLRRARAHFRTLYAQQG
jgi:RNA polymerase sigma-70 factor (ECF subfamily)